MDYTYDIARFRDSFEHEFTYMSGFLRNVRRFAAKTALRCPLTGRSWSYRELNAEANRLAHALAADGLSRQGVLMFLLPNSAEFVFCYLASQKLGAISCPLNYRQGPGELALIIDESRPHVFVYDLDFAETAHQALALAQHRPSRVVMTDLEQQASAGAGEIAFRDYLAGRPESEPVAAVRPHIYDETTRLYTSGTTSRSKGVPLNSINEVLSAHDVMMHFPLNATDRTMNMTPWFHRGGLHSGGPTPTLYAGGEVVILRDFHPRRCLNHVASYGVTFLIGVPTVIDMLSRAHENAPADLSSLRGIVTMGSPLEKADCERYLKTLTPRLFNGYGTTETFWNTFLRPYHLPELSGSAGLACTDDEVRLVRLREDGPVDPDDLAARDGKEVGEILIKAPAKSCSSYFNNEALSAEKFRDGYLCTGDLGTWDDQECVTIVGRKDDMIVSAGENIYPTQIEAVLNEHPKVAESAVVGVKDRLRGQIVSAWIVPADESLSIADLKDYCLRHPMLSPYKRPRLYRLVDALPRTATGKIMRFKLRERLE